MKVGKEPMKKTLLLLGLVFVGFPAACWYYGDNTPSTQARGYSPTGIKTACRNAISAQLKAPATAEFDMELGRAAEDPNIMRVTATVDAQNSFGAMLRTKFQCDVTKEGKVISAQQID
jgi:hypothetical protein